MVVAKEAKKVATVSQVETEVGGVEADSEVAALVVSLEDWKEVAI